MAPCSMFQTRQAMPVCLAILAVALTWLSPFHFSTSWAQVDLQQLLVGKPQIGTVRKLPLHEFVFYASENCCMPNFAKLHLN